MDTKEKLSPVTIALHWIVALGIIALTGVGFYMATFEVYSLFHIHKSVGMILLVVILARVLWRWKNGWPVPVREYPAWEHRLAVAVHWVLILGSVAMPISGFLFSGAGGYGVDVFGLVIAPANPDPLDPQKVVAYNEAVSHFGHEVHEVLGNLLTGAIILHIAGAIKHHHFDKDRTLLRMKGK